MSGDESNERIVNVPIVLVNGGVPPRYAHPGDAGADLCANIRAELAPSAWAPISTGVRLALPPGTVGLVHSRSGLAAKHGIFVLNAPGVVDAGYRGEVKVVLANFGFETFVVEPGMRIAQLVVQNVVRAHFTAVDALVEHQRGTGGFGSTGIRDDELA